MTRNEYIQYLYNIRLDGHARQKAIIIFDEMVKAGIEVIPLALAPQDGIIGV